MGTGSVEIEPLGVRWRSPVFDPIDCILYRSLHQFVAADHNDHLARPEKHSGRPVAGGIYIHHLTIQRQGVAPREKQVASQLTAHDLHAHFAGQGRYAVIENNLALLFQGALNLQPDDGHGAAKPDALRVCSLGHDIITSKEIQRSLSTLTEKERGIINMFYGIGVAHSYTLEEIGATYDLTRERVRQIKEKAIRRLKHSSRSNLLRAYLG